MALLLSGCSAKLRFQGEIEGHAVACSDVAKCGAVLDDFFRQNPDDRIAGIDAISRWSVDLVIWTTNSSNWPRAKDLVVATVPCNRTAEGPDCLSPIDTLQIRAESRHEFFVPLSAEQQGIYGSWSFLDVQTKGASKERWTVVDIPCRLEKGQTWFADIGDVGVMSARAINTMRSTQEGPTCCEPALTAYLRDHPALGIHSILAEDDAHGTKSLLLLTGESSDSLPRARNLSVAKQSCSGTENCASSFISFRKVRSPRSLFSVAINTRLESVSPTAELLIVSVVE